MQLLANELQPLRDCPPHENVVGLYGINMQGTKRKDDGSEVPCIYIA